MGVHGLWPLLEPVGRRMNIRALAGKRLAIDASIWLYQFMKVMRNDDGEFMKNGHLLGFFRRICRLLFNKIRPVFVFDGATPVLKRLTVAARRRRREVQGAQLRKTAEKLLMSQLRARLMEEEKARRAVKRGPKPVGALALSASTAAAAASAERLSPRQGTNGKQRMVVHADLTAGSLSSDEGLEDEGGAGDEGEQGALTRIIRAGAPPARRRRGGQREPAAISGNSGGAAQPPSVSGVDGSSSSGGDAEAEVDVDAIVQAQGDRVDAEVIGALPPSLQMEVVTRLRDQQLAANRIAFQDPALDPRRFSAAQMRSYLKRTDLRRQVDGIRDRMNEAAGYGSGGAAARPIAAHAGRAFILHDRGEGGTECAIRAPVPQLKRGKLGEWNRKIMKDATTGRLLAGPSDDVAWSTAAPGLAALPAVLPGSRVAAPVAARAPSAAPLAEADEVWLDLDASVTAEELAGALDGERVDAGAREDTGDDGGIVWEDVVGAGGEGGAAGSQPGGGDAGTGLAGGPGTQAHWRERAAFRQQYWSRLHGFKLGRKLGEWSKADEAAARAAAAAGGERDGAFQGGPDEAEAPTAGEEESVVQAAILASLAEQGPGLQGQQGRAGGHAPRAGAGSGRGVVGGTGEGGASEPERASVAAPDAPPARDLDTSVDIEWEDAASGGLGAAMGSSYSDVSIARGAGGGTGGGRAVHSTPTVDAATSAEDRVLQATSVLGTAQHGVALGVGLLRPEGPSEMRPPVAEVAPRVASGGPGYDEGRNAPDRASSHDAASRAFDAKVQELGQSGEGAQEGAAARSAPGHPNGTPRAKQGIARSVNASSGAAVERECGPSQFARHGAVASAGLSEAPRSPAAGVVARSSHATEREHSSGHAHDAAVLPAVRSVPGSECEPRQHEVSQRLAQVPVAIGRPVSRGPEGPRTGTMQVGSAHEAGFPEATATAGGEASRGVPSRAAVHKGPEAVGLDEEDEVDYDALLEADEDVLAMLPQDLQAAVAALRAARAGRGVAEGAGPLAASVASGRLRSPQAMCTQAASGRLRPQAASARSAGALEEGEPAGAIVHIASATAEWPPLAPPEAHAAASAEAGGVAAGAPVAEASGDGQASGPWAGPGLASGKRRIESGRQTGSTVKLSGAEMEATRGPQLSQEVDIDAALKAVMGETKSLKRSFQKQAGQQDAPTDEMFRDCQELLQYFGLPYIIAPTEAEAQCAWLQSEGLVDGVVTDDNDALLFGATRVYRHFFEERHYCEAYSAEDIQCELGLTRERLAMLALLLGSDYTEGIAGIGIVNAMETLSTFPTVEALEEFREWVESPDLERFGALGKRLGGAGAAVGHGKRGDGNNGPAPGKAGIVSGAVEDFQASHRTVSKNWQLPPRFPDPRVLDAYRQPKVDTGKGRFEFRAPDVDILRPYCQRNFGWSQEQVDTLLLPVARAYQDRQTQMQIESFVTITHRFAKIRSKRLQSAVAGVSGVPVRSELVLKEEAGTGEGSGGDASEESGGTEGVAGGGSAKRKGKAPVGGAAKKGRQVSAGSGGGGFLGADAHGTPDDGPLLQEGGSNRMNRAGAVEDYWDTEGLGAEDQDDPRRQFVF